MTDEQLAGPDPSETDIAIVGMAGRFPGASDVDELWRRAAAGDDCLTDLSAEQLAAAGVPRSVSDDPDYVRRAGVLDHVEGFDAGFFGIGPRDASIMDPQHRHFMELCWEALETSGHVPERFDGAIGVFAGCGFNTYMLHNLLTNAELVDQVGMFLLRHTANDKDFLSTTVSYRLDLRGPSVNVQTACSTSLVAVHLAVQSLLAFECDIALAGGSTIQVPHFAGYTYHEGEILSPDGYCRAFDERSAGTVLTSGAGVVALRRMADALDGDDPILAVVKGSAINNDGQRKVGYLAPSVDGHADVVQEALAVAGLSARDIQLLEAHGTGTSVGDPIEVAALTEAFRASTDDTGFCRLVSSKPGIGHLDTAAGVASLIKAVQALRHQTLPPLANHTAPSPLLDLDRTPFVLSATAAPWPGGAPRRAGVSSLGVGGTNAHVVIEEAPPRRPAPPAPAEQLLALSAVDGATLDETARRLADALEADPTVDLADVAHTLAAGRRAMSHRRVVAATDTATAIDVLRGGDRNRVATAVASDAPARIAFLFPGGGSQYLGMGAGLDERFAVFHEVMADGIRLVEQRSGLDLAPLLRPDAPPEALRRTTASLPAVFLTSVALARQWMAWGVTPDAYVGHSLGEYTAAHLAGVLSLEGALDLILSRAALMDRVSGVGAAMLAVPLPVGEVEPLLAPSLSVATINATDECVIAGPSDDLEILAKRVAARDVEPTLIPLDAAAHSSMLDPVLPEFLDTVRGIPLTEPDTPYLSNLTGTWITAEQATDPGYWVDHLRHTVRFADCLRTALADGPLVTLEMGPGHSLSSYARRQETAPVAAIPVLRHPNQAIDDTAYGLLAAGRAWTAGVELDLDGFAGPGRRLVRLPGYPFRREHHWIEPGTHVLAASAPSEPTTTRTVPEVRRTSDVADSFWAPTWVEQPRRAPDVAPQGPWLLVGAPDDDLVGELARALVARGHHAEVATTRAQLESTDARSIVLVGPTSDVTAATERWLAEGSLAARALAAADGSTLLAAVTRGATDVDGPAVAPADAMATGIIGTAPREYQGLRTAHVDLAPSTAGDGDAAADAATVLHELFEGDEPTVARRGDRRLVPRPEREAIASPPPGSTFRTGGRYLVTGGLGGVGFAVAARLASRHGADLAVVASRPVPEGAERERWLAHHAPDDPTSRRIGRLAELEALGTTIVVVTADVADPASVAEALDRAEAALGPLDGVVHAAGEVRDRPIELATEEDHEVVLGAKARGALALVDELGRRGTDLLVLVSSTSTVLAPEGQAAYVAANGVLDALAGDHGTLRVRTVDYGLWSETGATSARRYGLGLEPGSTVAHPVLSTSSVERDGTLSLVGTLDTRRQWVVDEHRTTDGVAVLPGTGHLELFLAAATLSDLDGHLDGVTLVAPLVVPDGASVIVRVQISPLDQEGRRGLRLESDAGTGRWHLHSEAHLVPTGPAPIGTSALVEGPPARPAGATDVDVVSGPAARMHFGPRWHTVVDAWLDGDEVVGRLALPEPLDLDTDAWLAHPALVDVATMFGIALGDHPDHLHVPIAYGRVSRAGSLPRAPWVRARRSGSSSADVLRIDVTLGSDAGALLRVEGLALRPIADSEVLGLGAVPEEEPVEHAHRVPPLLAVAGPYGIHADEGVEMLERLLGSGRRRLIASSIELDDLLPLVAPPAPAVDHPAAGPAAPGATTSVLSTIREIWVELLGVADVGDDDDFFDLGGHSLIAIRLMARIHKQLGVRFQLATIFDAPTVAALADEVRALRPELDDELAAGATPAAPAAAVGAGTTAAPHRSLVTITTEGDERPLFVVHGAGGNVLFLWTLARAMAGTRPLYGFQARGVDGGDMPDATIEAMAERYVAELRAAHDGPYLLGGYSGGGLVAFEMVRQLQALGEQVDQLVLFDSPVPGEEALSAGEQWYWFLKNVRRVGLRSMKPYVRWRARELTQLYLPFLGKRGRKEQIADAARQIGAVDVENLGFVDLYSYFSAAARRYRMPRLDVRVLLVKADRTWPVHPPDYHWSRFIVGDHIDVISTPGDHWAMFYPENAPYLAEALMPALQPASR